MAASLTLRRDTQLSTRRCGGDEINGVSSGSFRPAIKSSTEGGESVPCTGVEGPSSVG
jgi:hypothetical protein